MSIHSLLNRSATGAPKQALRRLLLLDCLRPTKAARAASRRVGFESLEQRAMMIVGANSNLPPISLGLFTGVAFTAGDAANFPSAPRCTGFLLETGRHILTAGHCVVKNEIQNINILPTAPKLMSGSFVLSFNGELTSPIPVYSSPSVVENALEALPSITNVDVKVGGQFGYKVEFIGNLAVTDVPTMVALDAIEFGSIVVTTARTGALQNGDTRFDLPSGSYTFPQVNADTVVHPLFKNLSFSDNDGDEAGYDIAITTLPSIAPKSAERYQLYQNRDEIESLVTFVGYGRTGQGATGENIGPPDTAGVRRAGLNVIDAIHASTGYLQTDFDDGTEATNVMGGLGLGPLETTVVRGDSGGPGLVEGRIAGIHASVGGSGGWGGFGNVLYMTRVSDFVQNRDALFDIHDIIEKPDDIVLDMNLQDAGNNRWRRYHSRRFWQRSHFRRIRQRQHPRSRRQRHNRGGIRKRHADRRLAGFRQFFASRW